jgi:hypothetical protein
MKDLEILYNKCPGLCQKQQEEEEEEEENAGHTKSEVKNKLHFIIGLDRTVLI